MAERLLPVLFDGSIATEEVDPFSAALSELRPEEGLGFAGAPERFLEFRAGRHCARRALERLGVVAAPVRRAPDRSPIWPPGVVGSITHTRRTGFGFCGAAVARDSRWRSIGLDAEIDDALDERLFERVLTEVERSRIDRFPAALHGRIAKIVFSAKESVYKCQHPISGEFLGFLDVEVELAEGARRFQATLRRPAGPFATGFVFEGRYSSGGGVVATAVTLAR